MPFYLTFSASCANQAAKRQKTSVNEKCFPSGSMCCKLCSSFRACPNFRLEKKESLIAAFGLLHAILVTGANTNNAQAGLEPLEKYKKPCNRLHLIKRMRERFSIPSKKCIDEKESGTKTGIFSSLIFLERDSDRLRESRAKLCLA